MEVLSAFLGEGCGTSPYNEGSKYASLPELDIKGLNGDVLIPIDDLLDFSSEEIAGPIWKGSSQVAVNCSDTSAGNQTTNEMVSSKVLKSQPLSVSVDTFKEQIPGIGVPCEEIAELEWLSNFVEESFSLDQDYKLFAALGPTNMERTVDQSDAGRKQFQTSSPVSVLETGSISTDKITGTATGVSLRGRPRSKRSRTGIRSWSNGSSSSILVSVPAVSDFSTLCDSPCLSSNSSQSTEQPTAFIDVSAKGQPFSTKCFKYEAKRKHQVDEYPIRCTHCGIQKTPQWRAGPLGPKTLCNACGVRYKSGRLLPEYRPAASPEYVPEKHSNSHKRVLEMRLQKGLQLLHKQQREQ